MSRRKMPKAAKRQTKDIEGIQDANFRTTIIGIVLQNEGNG